MSESLAVTNSNNGNTGLISIHGEDDLHVEESSKEKLHSFSALCPTELEY